jgi:hypothetical protein
MGGGLKPNNMSNTIQKEIKRFYVSGKITGIDLKVVQKKFQIGCEEVQFYHQADFVVNPLTIKPFLGIKHWAFHMINDIREQRKCTHTAFLSNWKESKGAVIEYFFAKFIFKHTIVFL